MSHTEARRDLNITPLIDVLLVLIVIFMAALPLTQRGIDTQLPSSTRTPAEARQPSEHIVLDYTADKKISVNHEEIRIAESDGVLRSRRCIRGSQRTGASTSNVSPTG